MSANVEMRWWGVESSLYLRDTASEVSNATPSFPHQRTSSVNVLSHPENSTPVAGRSPQQVLKSDRGEGWTEAQSSGRG